jgi:hypothetical protein
MEPIKCETMKTVAKIIGVVYSLVKVMLSYGKKAIGVAAMTLPFLEKQTITKKAIDAIRHIPLSKFKFHLN